MERKASNPNSPLHQTLNLNFSRASASSPTDFFLFLQPNFSGADLEKKTKHRKTNCRNAVSVDRTRDLQIFSLTLSQLSYPRKSAGHYFSGFVYIEYFQKNKFTCSRTSSRVRSPSRESVATRARLTTSVVATT